MIRGWWAGFRYWSEAATDIEPCHHHHTIAGRLTRRCSTAAAWSTRCPGPDGTTLETMADGVLAGLMGGDQMALLLILISTPSPQRQAIVAQRIQHLATIDAVSKANHHDYRVSVPRHPPALPLHFRM